MNAKKKRNLIIGLGLVALVGGSLAYFNQSMEIKNPLSTQKYGSEVIEHFTPEDDWQPGVTVNKDVTVENTGDYNLIARVTWNEWWERKESDEKYEENSLADVEKGDKSSSVTKTIADTENWVYGGDGYYYYLNESTKGQSSGKWLDSITLNQDADMGTIVKTTYYTKAANEPEKTAIGNDDTTQWVELENGPDGEAPAVPDGATFVRRVADTDPDALGYSNSDYTLEIKVEVMQATKEAVAIWNTGDITNSAVVEFLNGID